MFYKLQQINQRPKAFEFCTVADLWTDPYRAQQMLKHHLDGSVDISSRRFSFIQASVDWIESYFQLNASTKIADLGCGPGLYTTALAQKGAQVTGIDFSINSLNYAKAQAQKKKLNIQYIHNNYLDIQLNDKFDLVIMIFDDFCALSYKQRKKLLKTIHSILNPKGKVLLDVLTETAFHQVQENTSYTWSPENGFWSEKPYYEFKTSFKYTDDMVFLDKYTIIEENKTYEIYNWLQYFSQKSLIKEFDQGGFEIQNFFNNVAGDPKTDDQNEMAIVALKK